MDRVQVVRELADLVIDKYSIQAGGVSHYAGCWKVHMYCFAQAIKEVTEGDQPA